MMGCTKEPSLIKNYAPIEQVQTQIDKLVPVELEYDKTLLKGNEQQALYLLVKAAQLMDSIFLEQVYSKNDLLLKELRMEEKPDYAVLQEYFTICFGPFDRLEQDRPFINLSEGKPAGANFYPADMSKDEFQNWLKDNPGDEAAFTSNFTLIRRENNKLVAVPYSQAYREKLMTAADFLRQAANLIDNPSLKKYLLSRADAFLTNDYFNSDMDWMDLTKHTIEIVIGPYEVYEDELFNYKASFEAFITLVDPVESNKLRVVGQYLNQLERNLPIPARYRNTRRGSATPIVVVQEVFSAGDTKAGIQTTAFNLPNDERVREAKGSKKVMLKNVAQAKFQKCWIPIVHEVIAPEELPFITFEAYFNHVLMHEMSHGLGPGTIRKNGQETTVNKELRETYSIIEEAKADILGVYNTQFLIRRGVLPDSLEWQTYSTFLGGIFRSVRFGITSAHGGANAISFNYIQGKGGFEYIKESGQFRVNREKIKRAVTELARELLLIEATGDYEAAVQLIEKYRNLSLEMQNALKRLENVPVDIRPIFTIEREISQ
jgi:hypothetical protein